MSRRDMMKATAGAGALALGVGSGIVGNAAGGLASFDDLTASSNNVLVNESDEPFKLRGLNIPDPRRLSITSQIRGKTPAQIIDLLTNNERGWYPRAIRVPAQPADIGEHPNGHAGPVWEASELNNPDALRNEDGEITRRKKQPAQPVAFDQDQLDSYLENFYDPVVEQCRQRGVYCIVDYHRHWHEQPPGTADPSGAENHVAYDADWTNYWAYNTYSGDNVEFGTDTPASWGWVDQKYINEGTPGYDGWAGVSDESDISGTPYAEDAWEVNQELVDECTMFWETVAERYADEPHVIFEAYNEPTAPGIWGPENGCGAIKQKPLWNVFLNDFMGPIIDTIRQSNPDGLILTAPMGWAQSLQALHWENFDDAGYGNVAAVWHNYAGHGVSQMQNWHNDTDYMSPSEVESETGEPLTDPYIEPPDSVDSPQCWGWEGYEAQGLQNAYEHHPIVVTEFGWIDDPEVSRWLRGSTTGLGTTDEYGQPMFDALEADDRISYTAWCADVRWLPTMFDVTWTVSEGDLPLTNDNWYHPETDVESIPDEFKCPDELPCEWELMGNPNSGQFIKSQLEEYATSMVPFETEAMGTGDTGPTTTTTTTTDPGDNGDGTPGMVGDNTAYPSDPDGDGLYEDVNGNERQDIADAVDLFQNRESVDEEYFDFNDANGVSIGDAVSLFRENT